MHVHKCGFDPTTPKAKGCGHVWVHERPPEGTPTQVYNHAHLCPICKAGPWLCVFDPDARELKGGVVIELLVFEFDFSETRDDT